MAEQTTRADLPSERLARIPPLIDVDAHVVEPPDLWSSRLPARLREAGPRIEYAPAGEVRLVDGRYVETPGTAGPDVAWWVYEDTRNQIKRYVAAAGVPAEEVTDQGITYDDMRPGCWIPAERLADMDRNGVQAQMCFPNHPRFCGQIFLWGQGPRAGRTVRARLQRLDGRGVVRLWRRPADPVVRRPAVGRGQGGRRGAAQRGARRAGGGLQRAARLSGAAQPALPVLGSVLRRLRRDRHGGVHAHRLGHQDPADLGGRPRGRGRDHHLRQRRGQHNRLPVLRRAAPLPGPEAAVRRGADRLDPLPAGAHRRRVGDPPGLVARPGQLPEPPSTYYHRQITSCFFKDTVGVELLEKVGVDNVTFETDYPHQDGTWPRSREAAAMRFGHLEPELIHKIARGNAIRLLGLDLPG